MQIMDARMYEAIKYKHACDLRQPECIYLVKFNFVFLVQAFQF